MLYSLFPHLLVIALFIKRETSIAPFADNVLEEVIAGRHISLLPGDLPLVRVGLLIDVVALQDR